MAGCFKALRFWRKKNRADDAAYKNEKPRAAFPNPEKPPLEVQHVVRVAGAFRSVPVRPTVNPAFHDGTKWKDEGDVSDPEEVARRKKAEQEEQDRLDFFQMM
ncbi:hypothetical protein C8A00DRAFT_37490 [Chaetomidium leptoderma]|uniref:Uncharacterized protein n=1 Tax=Chaetomidium leptoderma TaxID=669021 RepID=A0AAN6VEM3_9PEZI|nr:hypothetical protein C8A00DRAFT_37490 [Chaetomidium leptoderma]